MRHLVIVGGSRDDRLRAARAEEAALARTSSPRVSRLNAETLPFLLPQSIVGHYDPPRLVRVDDLEHAFPNRQAQGTRLVLTQSTYVLQAWIDALDDGRFIATAERAGLGASAPEAWQRRGPWRLIRLIDLDTRRESILDDREIQPSGNPPHTEETTAGGPVADLLARAFGSGSSADRLALCKEAMAKARASAVAALALASAHREQQDLATARFALDRAIDLAPRWAAAHYEDGKFWLGCEEMEKASEAFRRACDAMPTFSAAFSNLGATLGELDRPELALAAFEHALVNDPNNVSLLNNLGVVNRELGRLDASEAALRQAIAHTPDFVFGHYNLGHTLFLAARYGEAVAAYEQGQRRDPEKSVRQGCRLAMARFAAGDLAGAGRDLWSCVARASSEDRDDLLLEAHDIGSAVLESRRETRPARGMVLSSQPDREIEFLTRIAAILKTARHGAPGADHGRDDPEDG